MTGFNAIDFYSDRSIVDDPHPYFDWLRQQGPVTRLEGRNVVAVTGYEEAIAVLLDTEHFSAINAIVGPLGTLPFAIEGDDITALVEAHRRDMPFGEEIISFDGAQHRRLRSLLVPIFAPGRLKAKCERFRRIAQHLVEGFASGSRVELVGDFAQPFVTFVISELLGIPEPDRERFREFMRQAVVANVGASDEANTEDHLAPMGRLLSSYLRERRARPRDDVLGELAAARFPDGSEPSIEELTRLAAFLFGAGQDTTARVMSNGFRLLAEAPGVQARLRADPALIPAFIEEMLRFDGSVKSSARLCIRSTEIGGTRVAAGETVMLALLAANHDPARFARPEAFDMERPRLAEHVAFGRGAHTCLGAPLARMEFALALEVLLGALGEFRLAEDRHGPANARRVPYIPSFLLRGVRALHLEFEPVVQLT